MDRTFRHLARVITAKLQKYHHYLIIYFFEVIIRWYLNFQHGKPHKMNEKLSFFFFIFFLSDFISHTQTVPYIFFSFLFFRRFSISMNRISLFDKIQVGHKICVNNIFEIVLFPRAKEKESLKKKKSQNFSDQRYLYSKWMIR